MSDKDEHNYIVGYFGNTGPPPADIFIRPKNHPFLKEVIVYTPLEITIKYLYREDHLDTLIPPEILRQYENDSFNLEEFICFKENLLYAMDQYYGVDSKCYNKSLEKEITCKREKPYRWDNWKLLDKKYSWYADHNRKDTWYCCKSSTVMSVDFSCDFYDRRRYVLDDGRTIDEKTMVSVGTGGSNVVKQYEYVTEKDAGIYIWRDYPQITNN